MRPHERIYHCLLFILPSSMRQEAGDELFETFNQEYARVVDAGRWARAVLTANGCRPRRGLRRGAP